MFKQMINNIRAILVAILFALVATYIYQEFISPTKVGLINYRDFQIARMIKANENDWIKIDKIEKSAVDEYQNYDVIYLFGRGLSLNQHQIEAFKNASEAGVKIVVQAVNNPKMDITNLNEENYSKITAYLGFGGSFNYKQLLRYSRTILDDKSFGVEPAEPVQKIDRDVLFHLDESKKFTEVADYQTYYQTLPQYNPNGKKIALLTSVPGPFNANRDHLDALINQLEKAGMRVYPVASRKRRLNMLKDIKPDAVIMMPHGRLQLGSGSSAVDWLRSQNIPLFAPLSVFENHKTWRNNPQGYRGGMLTMNIVMPEIDGAVVPYVINAQFTDKQNLQIFKAIPKRLNSFIDMIEQWFILKDAQKSKKKLAIVYFKGPGKNALVAGNMEVVPSLFNTLHQLKNEGYDLGSLPDDYQQFKKDINRQGAVMAPYAKGLLSQFFEQADPALIDVATYSKWCYTQLSKGMCEQISEKFGKPPGNFMVTHQSGKPFLGVARLQYGNIVLLPQPLPGLGEDSFKLVHGTDEAPPHSYVAPYMWIKEIFKADAIVHYGTHGSLEFTRGKQVALSSFDWADALIGDTPHFYVYTMSNVGEAIIAKRRTYATVLSHLTPPFQESGLYSELKTLADSINEYQLTSGAVKQALAKQINNLIMSLELNQDLQLTIQQLSLQQDLWQQQVLEPVIKWLETIAQSKITEGLYTLGKPFTQNQAKQTAMLIVIDTLAKKYTEMALHYQLKKIDDKALRQRAKNWIEQVLNGGNSQKMVNEIIKDNRLSDAKMNVGPVDLKVQQQLEQTKQLFEQTLANVNQYRLHLLQGAQNEMDAFNNAFNGGYILPSSGGDPIVNPAALPTGRNMFSIDAEKTPSIAAWSVGKKLAQMLLNTHQEETGSYPKKVSFTLWPSEFIHSHGATIAEILYLLGVEPVRDPFGRVTTLRLIDSKTLGRPRIDIVVQSAGQLRDLAASRLALIEQAVVMAAKANDDVYPNFVANGVVDAEQYLLDKGIAPLVARNNAYRRSFGGANGAYGTGIMSHVEQGASWETDSQIAKQYINNMGAVYADDKSWGEFVPHLFEAALQNTEIVIQPRSSNTWGMLSLDHVYEFMGGLNLAVREVTGNDPKAYFNDFRNPNNTNLQTLNQALWTEMRTTLLNPKYIKAMINGEASSAEHFAETFRNTFGWNVMKPDAIDDVVWDKLYQVYVEDINNMNLKQFFARENPFALQEMSGVMLETARKGLWQASEKQLKSLADLHARLVQEHQAGCGTFTCGNPLLQDFIKSKLTQPVLIESYQKQLDAAQIGRDVSKGLVLQEQPLKSKVYQNTNTQSGDNDVSDLVENKAQQAIDNKQVKADTLSTTVWVLLFFSIAGLIISLLGRKNVQP
ncbi:hypothetical protein CJF42_14175 [Pseudoalteromonas sp. NBT06-2]|uniref:cobaltochelatase subunit CobN n=1 Tax=Pseudoalteromonas sp. NBT06-2 TaxID=2025950 RepID=UPI000BA73B98|nr:cobaltochelatase subunit CobN [Pseudoalteromonas sp. NBT06-2]PAJ73712.1 hypothetical protein CJF42_14175 [Pseudoalteromonas sp. NBT06-2]